MSSNVKEFKITGGAAAALQGGAATRGRRRAAAGGSRKRVQGQDQAGGAPGMSVGTAVQMSAADTAGAPIVIEKVVGTNSALTEAGAPLSVAPAAAPAVAAAAATPAAAVPQTGGVKVILKPKKKSSHVVLQPKKGAATAAAAAAPTTTGHKKTRKASRSVKMSLPGLSRKMRKAKTIHQSAAKESLEQVKRTLHKAGLVKAETKAPESILRQMYADFMVLKNRAL